MSMSTLSVQIAGKGEGLGKRLGSGGEGEVYALASRGDLAVKIYKENVRFARESKVRAMVDGQLSSRTSLVAFPSAIATDSSGRFLGFVMRLVGGYRPLHELYSPKSRKLQFPKADYRFLVRVAQNVARAVATVHQAGCIIGDLNHSGVLVGADATVALIDADSFQFKLGGRSFPCVVGVPEFTPPELQGTNLAQIERTPAHDNFGLAVAIFQLLAMGKHPYAGRYSGADLTLGEAIAQHRFAFSVNRRNETLTIPPPGSMLLNDFPSPIAQAFEASFGRDPHSRPSPEAWVNLLGSLEVGLRKCSALPTHYFPGSSSGCTWCRITGQSGVEMFPSSAVSGSVAPGNGAFDLEKICAAIRATPIPRLEDLLPKWTGDLGSANSAVAKAGGGQTKHGIFGSLLLVAAVIGFFALPPAWLIWFGLGGLGLFHLREGKIDAPPLRKAYEDADSRVRSLSMAYLKRIGFIEIQLLRDELEDCADQYRKLESDLAEQLAHLKSTRERRQREAFLDRFLIRRAKISGIGPAKITALASFGIETAADVEYLAVMAVPGFGEALTKRLLTWRQQQEAKFRYNAAPDPADTHAENTLRAGSASKAINLQNRLRAGLAALQSAPQRFAAAKSTPDPALVEALAERAKVARDCAQLGISLPPSPPINIPAQARMPVQTKPQTPISSTSRPTSPIPLQTSRTPSCPKCGASMVRRTARKGVHAGNKFWGCSRYPSCKGSRN